MPSGGLPPFITPLVNTAPSVVSSASPLTRPASSPRAEAWRNVGDAARRAEADLAAALDSVQPGAAAEARARAEAIVGNIRGASSSQMAGGAFSTAPGSTGAPGTVLADGSVIVDDVVITRPRTPQLSDDRRVRLKAIVGQEENVYGPNEPENLLSILHSTGGMLFPYTPTIAVNQDVDYRSADLTHTNMDIMSYNRTPSVTLSVTGRFTVQNQREGRYALAVLHFLRVVSKMHFGEIDAEEGKAGLPPPILCFDGYGNYMFNNLQCVLKAHNYTFDDTVDYVDVKSGNSVTRVPSLFTISLTLTVTRSPQSQRSEFNMADFRTGRLMRGGNKGWI